MARLPGGACEIDIIHNGEDASEAVYSRPNIRHVHQLLQITEDELRSQAGAEMVMALPYSLGGKGEFPAPLGDYGVPRSGCDFQHYWRRAFAEGQAKVIEHYNFALRLNAAGHALPRAPQGLPITDLAYKFNTKTYAQLLTGIARSIGPLNIHTGDGLDVALDADGMSKVSLSGQALKFDLIIDMRGNQQAENQWTKNCVSIHPDARLAGLPLYIVQSAIDRLFSLWPDQSYHAAEPQEYNRLAAEERAHIDDMTALLSGDVDKIKARERLQRKINLFQSRGRVSFEDYDIFSKAEWIATLRASGIYQTGYDRLADRESLGDIQRWLDTISCDIEAQITALKGKL